MLPRPELAASAPREAEPDAPAETPRKRGALGAAGAALLAIAVKGKALADRMCLLARPDELADVTDADRRIWAIRYFGPCFFLGAATFFTHHLLGRQGF